MTSLSNLDVITDSNTLWANDYEITSILDVWLDVFILFKFFDCNQKLKEAIFFIRSTYYYEAIILFGLFLNFDTKLSVVCQRCWNSMAIEIKDDSHIDYYSYIVGRNILNFYLHETVLNLFKKNYDHLSCPPSEK